MSAFDRIGKRITHSEFRRFARERNAYFYRVRWNKRKKGQRHRNPK